MAAFQNALGSPEVAARVPVLRVANIHKSFGDAQVLKNVSFDLLKGEVHVLLGENGAGKSTLMNILVGLYTVDSGHVELDGAAVTLRSPLAALRHGIGMVHQHFKLVGPLTARENIYLAASQLAAFPTDKRIDMALREVMDRVDLEVSLDTPVRQLSIAEQQRIEILKALTLGARILIMDEPTAVLTDEEALRVIALMRGLARDGVSIIFISHKLREAIAVGDRVSALRKGSVALSNADVKDVVQDDLTKAIMGADDIPTLDKPEISLGQVVLTVADMSLTQAGVQVLRGVTFEVRANEVLGIAGVGGNGQVELAEALVGLNDASSAELTLGGAPIQALSPKDRRALGLRYIPADRTTHALASDASINENLSAGAVRDGTLSRFWITPAKMRVFAQSRLEAFDVAGVRQRGAGPVRLLSGGNAQKVVLARELDGNTALIIAHSPTRGLDVTAQHQVHSLLIEAAAQGAGVVLISEDLEELLALSTRIMVMSRGALVAGDAPMPSRADIGKMMLGRV